MDNSQKIPMSKPRKLSRKQIREGLQAVPIERILMGAAGGGAHALTAKQRHFAEELAKGETKAGAYRKAYKSKGKPKTAHARGAELARDSRIQAAAEAKRAELEAEKSQTPAEIRELTIRSLVRHAEDESFPPAQRVKCLELLGKITEVALFTERREIVKTTDASEAKERLLTALRAAIKRNATTVEAVEPLSLIDELRLGDAMTIDAQADPPTAHPLNSGQSEGAVSHTIPHNESAYETGTPSDFPSQTGEGSSAEPTPYENGSPADGGDSYK